MALTRAVTDFKDSVKAATTADVTLSGGAPTTVDGITLLVNDSVLVRSQSTASQNGVYRVTTLGTGANGTWTRRSDFNAANQITGGALIFVEQGTINGNVYYYLAGGLGTVTVDTTSLSFSNLYSTIASGIAAGIYSNANVASYLPTYSGILTAGSVTTVSGGQLTGYHTGVIGANTANAGTFTTLTATSGYQGATSGAHNGTIGATTANTGAFTTITASSTLNVTGTAAFAGTLTAATLSATTIGNSSAAGTFSTLTAVSGYQGAATGPLNGTLGAGTPNSVVATSVTTTSGGQLIGYHTGAIGANTANTGVFTSVTTTSAGQLTGYHTGAIGANTANAGTFTTLTATSGYQGAASGPLNGTLGATTPNSVVATSVTTTSAGQLTGYHTGAIGANTANTGAFTTLTSSGQTGLANTAVSSLYTTSGVFWANGTAYSSGGGGTPGGANTYVQFNDAGTFGGSATFTFNKTSGLVTADSFAATNNGAGTNFKVGDDAWLGDINTSNTIGVRGQQNPTQGYIVFGDANNTNYIGRSGTNPITVTGAFSVTSAATAASVTTTAGGQLTGYHTGAIGANTANSGAFTTLTSSGQTGLANTAVSSLYTTSGVFWANGSSFSSGGGGGGITFTTSASAPVGPTAGNFWYNSSNDILYQYVNDGTSNFWLDISSLPSTFANVNITSNLTISGNVSSSIVPVLNNTYSLGSTTRYWSTVYGVAVNAQYADLAEIYKANCDLEPGEVVIFGGEEEITKTDISHDDRVAGVISTAPAYLMNSKADGYPVALQGRVPCLVRGPVSKGQAVVTSDLPGIAIALDKTRYTPGCIIGKSLGAINTTDIELIEVVVGRL